MDVVRLRHMLEGAEAALRIMDDTPEDEFKSDERINFGVVRAINILGEAAGQVSAKTRQHYPDLPWSEMTGMRNRLIHAYHDINLSIVWRTVSEDLPPLVERLQAILASIDSDTPGSA